MRKIPIIFFLLVAGSYSQAQEKHLESEEDIEILCEEVASYFAEKKVAKAFKILKPYWPLQENEIDNLIDKSVKMINVVGDRFGTYVETVLIKNERIKDFSLRKTYIIRYEFHAIRLIFTFYKNSSGWIINAFKWDDQYDEEFIIE